MPRRWASLAKDAAGESGRPERQATVDVKIGVQHSPRELTVDSDESHEAVFAMISEAIDSGKGVLSLVDVRGRRIVVPVERIAYVEIAEADHRRVGFSA